MAGRTDGTPGDAAGDAGGDTPPPGPSPAATRFTAALAPLLDAIGGRLIDPAEAGEDDVLLRWDGAVAAAVRLPQLSESLDHILADLRRRHGMPLSELDRGVKQQLVRSLEARGAFAMRHGVETVAEALGVSRFTVYNYLNRST
ncbi:helix-turn-helix domain-containing protein [Streptomyces avicenniae]|uniref:helix-turn-helix domain-containing protein n=1 Tax=Streptomyces avicenniae TaxID=500153 RepID=UPI000B2724E9|nr:helix-turn-helix domain-containing protein [Streptomyces avicenniae]